jgi:hypothetical protein
MFELSRTAEEQSSVHIQQIQYLEKWRSFCFFNGKYRRMRLKALRVVVKVSSGKWIFF